MTEHNFGGMIVQSLKNQNFCGFRNSPFWLFGLSLLQPPVGAGGPETPIKDSKLSIERYQRESSVASSIHWKGEVENKSDVTAFFSFGTFNPTECILLFHSISNSKPLALERQGWGIEQELSKP